MEKIIYKSMQVDIMKIINTLWKIEANITYFLDNIIICDAQHNLLSYFYKRSGSWSGKTSSFQ